MENPMALSKQEKQDMQTWSKAELEQFADNAGNTAAAYRLQGEESESRHWQSAANHAAIQSGRRR
jgi:hypothetical protein